MFQPEDVAACFDISRGVEDEEAFPSVPGTYPERGEGVFPVPDPLCEERGTPEPGLFYDMAALLAGGIPDPPEPRFGRRDDGVHLFYAGQVNVVFGDPESGKTWLVLAAAVDVLAADGKVLLLDLDHNGPEATATRLLSLGARPEWLGDPDRFRYVEPEDVDHIRRIVRAAVEWRPDLAIVDSVGELLPALGLSSNSPDDWTLGHTRVLKPLAMADAAVIAIDHLAKNADSRASGPTGTAAKKRAVGGVSLRVTVRDPFTPGRGGAAAITINKDRNGGLRKNCPAPDGKTEPYAGTFTLDSSTEVVRWAIRAPTTSDHAPGQVTRSDLEELAQLDPPPSSVRDVKSRLG